MRHHRPWWEKFLRQHRYRQHMGNDGSVLIYDAATHTRFFVHIWLRVGDSAVLLRSNERMYLMSQLHVNENVTLALQAVDVVGNIVDANFEKTQWNNSDEAAAKSTVSADGNSLTLDPVGNAVGKTTTVNVSTMIGGTLFTATVGETIVAGPVAGVNIIETFSPKIPPTT